MSNYKFAVKSKWRCTLLLVAFVLSIAGCQMPNVQPYADATARLRDAIQVAGETTVARLKGDRKPFDLENPPRPGDDAYPAWELSQLWEIRLAAANALVAYADSLSDITAAGNQAGGNAQKLGTTISGLASGLAGVSAPSQEVVALAAKLTELAIKVKASHDLAKAVERAQPAVEGIAELLTKDLDDLLICYQTAHRDLLKDTFLRGKSEKSKKYLQLATYRKSLKERVEQLREELKGNEFTNPADRDLTSELEQAEELLTKANLAFLPYQEEYLELLRERERVEQLFDQAKKTTAAWLNTHRDLSESITSNRRPSWRELLSITQELHVLVDAVREDNRNASRIKIEP
jgi:hypothetical protein